MADDLKSRLGFLVYDVARLYGRRFDRLARESIGLSRAQCRALGVMAMHRGQPLNQVALADELEMTPMGVATLCERMEAAGWIRRETSATDRRAKVIIAQPKAEEALAAALRVGEGLQAQVLAGFDAAERRMLLDLLQRMHGTLVAGESRVAGERR